MIVNVPKCIVLQMSLVEQAKEKAAVQAVDDYVYVSTMFIILFIIVSIIIVCSVYNCLKCL